MSVSEKAVSESKSKTKKSVTTKDVYASGIRIMLGARENQLTSLKNMAKKDLMELQDILVAMSEKFNLSA